MLEKKSMCLDALMPLIREQLDSGASVRIYPRGVSMLPMIREGKDSVVISSLPSELKKYDVILYQRRNGQYVLHRLIKTGASYTFLGDNQFIAEQGIEHDQLIAIVSLLYRDERAVSIDKFFYKFFCRMWCFTRPLRRLSNFVVSFVKRMVSKIIKSAKS